MADSVDFKITGDASQVLASLEKIVGKMNDVVGATKKMADESRKTRQAAEKTHSIFEGIGRYAAKFITVGAAIGVVKSAFNSIIEGGQKAKDAIDAQIDSLGKLAAASKSAGEFAASSTLSNQISMATGAAPAETNEWVRLAKQTRMSDADVRYVSGAHHLADPAAMISGMQSIKQFFPTAGTTPQLMNKLLMAGQDSKFDPAQIANAMIVAAPAAKAAGETDSGLLNAITVLAAGNQRGVRRTATGAGEFLDKANEEAKKHGKTLTGGLSEAFRFASDMTPKQQEKVFTGGARDFFDDYRTNQKQVQDRLARQSAGVALTGAEKDAYHVGEAALMSDPRMKYAERLSQAQQRERSAKEESGIIAMRWDENRTANEARRAEVGQSGLVRFAARRAEGVAERVGRTTGAIGPEFIRSASDDAEERWSRLVRRAYGIATPAEMKRGDQPQNDSEKQILTQIIEQLKRLNIHAASTASNTKQPANSPSRNGGSE